MIPTTAYDISESRATMRKFVRSSCVRSEQLVEKPGKNCSRQSDKALRMRILLRLPLSQSGALPDAARFLFDVTAISTVRSLRKTNDGEPYE